MLYLEVACSGNCGGIFFKRYKTRKYCSIIIFIVWAIHTNKLYSISFFPTCQVTNIVMYVY